GHKTVATLRALDLLTMLDTDRLLFAMKCAQMIELKEKPADGKASSLAEMAKAQRPPPLPPPLPPKLKVPVPNGGKLPLPWADMHPESPGRASARHPNAPFASPPAGGKKRPLRSDAPVLARASGSLLPELSGVVPHNSLSNEESLLRERLAAK